MRLYAGTSGYSYTEWKGHFYSEDLPAEQMLRSYAEQLPTVEINNSFYRVPKRHVVEAWAEDVPEDFRFALKATRRITHVKRIRKAETELQFMFEQLAGFKNKLGTVLFQLPPNLKLDLERLESFLASLPEGIRSAIEFRNDTWNRSETYELLRNANCALVLTDTEEEAPEKQELVRTADWAYLRLRREAYTDAQLERWIERIAAVGWSDVFCFFKHEDAGAGPRIAKRFLELAPKN